MDIANKAEKTPIYSQHNDITGKKRIVSNVIVGWVAQLIFVASGFILPRMIDNTIGKEALGIWDFAWSFIVYFELIYSGLVSSVNRYVAKHRANNDIDALNTAASSVFFLLLVLGCLVILCSAVSALMLPQFMHARFGKYLVDAQWLVFLLGSNISVKMPLALFGGVLTGCHRWDLQHSITAASRLATMLGMIVVLKLGGGLKEIALVYTCLEILVLSSRSSLAFRICHGLRISPSLIRRSTAINMWKFGFKSMIPDIGDLLSNQTFSLLLVWFLGPSALAGYARPRSLVRHIQTFVVRYAFTLTPMASSLQAMNNNEEMRDMLVNACRAGAFIVFPMTAVLAIMGGPLLQVWMGQNYADNILPLALGLGYSPLLIQLPLHSILKGVNAHGKPGLFKFMAAVSGISTAFVALDFFNSSILGATVAVILPFWISELIATPMFASKRLKFSLPRYWLVGMLQPLLIMTPMILCLLYFRFTYSTYPARALIGGVPLGLLSLAVSYWHFATTESFKKNSVNKLKSLFLH